jgi:fermentation-respiration switch protein FrsA (DUF1100 family)
MAGVLCYFLCCKAHCSPAIVASHLAFSPPPPSYLIARLVNPGDSPDGDDSPPSSSSTGSGMKGVSISASSVFPKHPRYRERVDRHGSRARMVTSRGLDDNRPRSRSVLDWMPVDGAGTDAGSCDEKSKGDGRPSSVPASLHSTAMHGMDPSAIDNEDLMFDGLIDVGDCHPWSSAVMRLHPGISRIPLPKLAVSVTLAPRNWRSGSKRLLRVDPAGAGGNTTKRAAENGIPMFCYLYPNAYFTILYSHGNATDAGLMKDTLADMCYNLRCNIVTYEYTGYGPTREIVRPLEKSVYSDIAAVHAHLLTQPFCRSAEQLILYGQSIGSGPTCHLAANVDSKAVVLHSPIASGLRVVTDNRCLACCDIFPNVDRVEDIADHTEAVYILHGQQDTEVPVTHGEQLYQELPSKVQKHTPPWFPQHAGHNDMVERNRDEYFARLRTFITRLAPKSDHNYVTDPIIPIGKISTVASKLWGCEVVSEPPGNYLMVNSSPFAQLLRWSAPRDAVRPTAVYRPVDLSIGAAKGGDEGPRDGFRPPRSRVSSRLASPAGSPDWLPCGCCPTQQQHCNRNDGQYQRARPLHLGTPQCGVPASDTGIHYSLA